MNYAMNGVREFTESDNHSGVTRQRVGEISAPRLRCGRQGEAGIQSDLSGGDWSVGIACQLWREAAAACAIRLRHRAELVLDGCSRAGSGRLAVAWPIKTGRPGGGLAESAWYDRRDFSVMEPGPNRTRFAHHSKTRCTEGQSIQNWRMEPRQDCFARRDNRRRGRLRCWTWPWGQLWTLPWAVPFARRARRHFRGNRRRRRRRYRRFVTASPRGCDLRGL